MFLTEQTPIASEDLPIQAFKAHLRLGTGFSDDDVQDALLDRLLRGAIGQVENLCAKALLMRGFTLTVHAWRDLGRQILPRAPLATVTQFAIIDLGGTPKVIAPERFHVERDAQRPSIVARGFTLPQIPVGGHAEIAFTAGYGASWDDVPADLANSVLALAALQYEDRTELGTIPPNVQTMLARYRQPRLLGGF
ncbi:hypothetical protein ILP92_04085 [Maribius pontilimi]|uniref:Phage gp6-like head-tail connector protein n=1 Tax=Palleronia pontilimi TaxID=1964209 RepID=A0A934MD36_9RHOB|nr:hypothetical protein [Palleronia pontilimi]MBJ3761926.1 hypothetical protein [Palleronia pontilimi]